ncbi:MAG: hypothetical protein E6H86_09095 [Chloroflexi bacterium]|nr:MAG: hypothetical protein E6H86_09095 [Chloroflexota bacterium]
MSAEPQRPAPPPPPPPPPPVPPQAIPPYYGRPAYPPPSPQTGRTEGRVLASLGLSLLGLLLGLTGLLIGGFGYLGAPGSGLVLAFWLAVPALVLGPVAYFLGKSGITRIGESKGALGGRGIAAAGWVIGVVAMAVGAAVTLIWLVLLLVANFGPPPP